MAGLVMADLNLKDALMICEAATPGPWDSNSSRLVHADIPERLGLIAVAENHEYEKSDAAFIAHARTAYPKILDAYIEELKLTASLDSAGNCDSQCLCGAWVDVHLPEGGREPHKDDCRVMRARAILATLGDKKEE